MLTVYEQMDVELMFLGCVMARPEWLAKSRMRPEFFQDQRHGRVFTTIKKLHESGGILNTYSLREPLTRAIGGDSKELLLDIFTLKVLPHEAFYWEWMLINWHARRKVARSYEIGVDEVEKDDPNLERIVADITDKSREAIRELMSGGDLRSIEDVSMEVVESMTGDVDTRRMFTGLFGVDDQLSMRPNNLVVLAARPGDGKTSFALQMAAHNATQGRKVLFCSLEMSATEIVNRMMVSTGLVKMAELENRTADPRTVHDAREQILNPNLKIWDAKRATMSEVDREVVRHEGLDMLVIDYLGFIDADDQRQQRYLQVGQIVRDCKGLAKEHQIAVVLLCQLNRDADNAVPRLSNLRESGSIEQDADVVLFLHRLKTFQPEYHLLLSKHRQGATGEFSLRFDAEHFTFE